MQLFAQLGAIVGLAAKHVFRWFHFANGVAGSRAVMRFVSGQKDGKKASLSICECMNLRVAPSSRAANRLLLLPPFHLLLSGEP